MQLILDQVFYHGVFLLFSKIFLFTYQNHEATQAAPTLHSSLAVGRHILKCTLFHFDRYSC